MQPEIRPYRLMFLGDRRISWEALKLLRSPQFQVAFDLRCLVTSPEMYGHYMAGHDGHPPRFIDNNARNTDAIKLCIEEERIDLILSVQYNWILPPAILGRVDNLAFNLHNARLPEYKGYNSIAHAILNGDDSHDSTLHWMANEVDSGDIAYIRQTKIRPDDTARSLYLRSVTAAVEAVECLLRDLKDGTAVPRAPMRNGRGAFYGRETASQLADLTEIPDGPDADRIARAAFFPPYTVAYRQIDNRKILVLPATEKLGDPALLPPANAPLYD
jgi:methionyl-tRNA formyltransferase